ncbi:F-box protein At4g00755-like [Impatiens glandulifera]|uniref:F-box protein At4g00755-like n=1 Tax=Impatiens glandulifera TaxID=253017 RepID=UPI001FB133B4|nr:F-box protein At4g00755-like [Impatiens glandulifera]
MEKIGDFIEFLGPDISSKILMCLDDPSDLVRATAVSRSWQRFVVENGLAKNLCVTLFPDLSSFIKSIQVKNIIEPVEEMLCNTLGWEYLNRNHRVYACMAHGLERSSDKSCISQAIVASSTDNYPDETIENTLEPSDRVDRRASYWSSEGEDDPTVPEALVYNLAANLCIISEIYVQPFQAYFQYGFPVYSAKSVRFKMGHPKSSKEMDVLMRGEYWVGNYTNDNFVWTYTSPEFPMMQENSLQKFSLPEPVLCIGGVLQIELLGRVQRQEMDGLYYICISHVKAVGRMLSPSFEVNVMDLSGRCTLEYCPPLDQNLSESQFKDADSSEPSNFRG